MKHVTRTCLIVSVWVTSHLPPPLLLKRRLTILRHEAENRFSSRFTFRVGIREFRTFLQGLNSPHSLQVSNRMCGLKGRKKSCNARIWAGRAAIEPLGTVRTIRQYVMRYLIDIQRFLSTCSPCFVTFFCVSFEALLGQYVATVEAHQPG